MKTKIQYVCQECGAIYNKWTGHCSSCDSWNSIVEEIAQKKSPSLKPNISNLDFTGFNLNLERELRIDSNISELNRVLGGGLVIGSAILIAGDPGIGKSTLLLQLASYLAANGTNAYYITGEESVSQVSLRAARLGLEKTPVKLLANNNLPSIIAKLNEEDVKNSVIIIDSIQTMVTDEVPSAAGTVTQVKQCANNLIQYIKPKNAILIIVGHVTKEGQIAGPKILEHMVDTVLHFEGERGYNFRLLRSIKNRFGAINEIGVFEMAGAGLKEVSNPSGLFLNDTASKVSGSVVFAGVEGTRPVLLEIQALVSNSHLPTPRRAVIGWDHNRLAMIIAVLAVRLGLNLSNKDIYLNVAGGMKIEETAADLAVALALVSAANNRKIKENSVIFGEIGLSGEVRSVPQAETRIKESMKLGFFNALTPEIKAISKVDGMSVTQISNIKHILQFLD